MLITIPKAIETPESERARRSLIKPHLFNLSGSGSTLNGVVIERNLERSNVDLDSAAVKAAKHLIVVHSANPARLEWKMDGRRKASLFAEGDAIINPVGLFVAPRWSAEVELLLLAIDPALVHQAAEEMNRTGRVELIPRFQFRDELVRQLARSLIGEFEQDLPPDRVYLESLTQTLIAHLIRKYSVAGIKPPSARYGLPPRKLARVVEYINDNLGEALSLEMIAKAVEISPSYFLTLFKQSTGMAPHQYVITRRIERAKVLLTQTRLPIAEIATCTGFADQSHLTRLMRRHTGLTPKMLRDG